MTAISPEAADRAAFLSDVCDLLWPAPAAAVAARGGAGDLFVLPSLRDPRLLVPTSRRAGAAAVRRYGEPGTAAARLGRRALELALASGAGPVLLRDRLRIRVPAGAPTLEAYRDLQSLFLLDPVHEVSEEGWPERATESAQE